MSLPGERVQKGFTLIELMVSITIIGILASVVLLQLNQTRVKSRDARRLEDIRTVINAIELYNSRFGFYPADDDLGSEGARWSLLTQQLRSAGFLVREAFDPINSTTYDYDYAAAPTYTAGGACPSNAGDISWVVSANLERPANDALSADIDCAFTGAARSCVDPVFCFTGR